MRPLRTTVTAVLAVLLAAAGCDDGEQAASPEAPATPTQTAPPTTPDDDPEPTATPGQELVRCESAEGFAVSYPATWSTNDGDGVAGCTQFHPEPFEVPTGTDERVAAITAYVDQVPFHEAAAPDPERDADRAATAIDGLQAVRLSFETADGLWPEGTPITTYVVDLSPGVDEGPGTLFLDTVGLPTFDYDRNQAVLDRIAHTIEVTREDVPAADDVVARYEGGGGAFTVEGTVRDDEVCLRIPPEGDEACADVPGAGDVRTITLTDLEPILAGVTGPEVFRVTGEREDGSTTTVLPAPLEGADVRGFAFTSGPDEFVRLRTFDRAGAELGTADPAA